MKKRLVAAALIGILAIVFSGCTRFSAFLPESSAATIAPAENASEDFTLLVYICGSDLESEDGAATYDISEMIEGGPGHGLNVVMQTGGAKYWQNTVISSKSVQRYEVTGEGVGLLEDIGQQNMCDPKTLSDFIKYGVDNYPAERYGLIMWDHGGGSLGGYGADENFGEATMSIKDMTDSFSQAGVHFDFVGFDCCLMATFEYACALEPYADYLIASEESEPGTGWYYTDFIDQLDNDPSLPVTEFARTIISDFISGENTDVESGVTLSLIDLGKIDNVKEKYTEYMKLSRDYLVSGQYRRLSSARASARAFGDDGYDQIDMIDYIECAGLEGSDELIDAISEAVVLNGTNLENSNGLSFYYPYKLVDRYEEMSYYATSIGIEDYGFSNYYNDFVSVMVSGQMSGGGTVNPYSGTMSDTDVSGYTQSDWYNGDISSFYEDSYEYVSDDLLEITQKNDYYVLALTDESWDLVTEVKLEAYIDDGEGYLALGLDDVYEFDNDGDLIVDHDNTWVFLNDSIVPYYNQEVGEYTDKVQYSRGYVPAELNGKSNIKIWIEWASDLDEPVVLGYTVEYNSLMPMKGYRRFKDNDKIDFYFDYYTYDGDFDASYSLIDNDITYNAKEGLTVSYQDIGDSDVLIDYLLVDIYGNEYWTEPLLLYTE